MTSLLAVGAEDTITRSRRRVLIAQLPVAGSIGQVPFRGFPTDLGG